MAQQDGLLWKKQGNNNRQFLFMPDSLYITHIYFVAMHPSCVHQGSQTAELVRTKHVPRPLTRAADAVSWPWAHTDEERLFDSNEEGRRFTVGCKRVRVGEEFNRPTATPTRTSWTTACATSH